MREVLRAQGLDGGKCVVISNWSDASALRPVPPDENLLRRKWGLDGKFVVGYSGNLGRAHEFGTVLEAAQRLRPEADIFFLFIGQGKGRGELLKAAQAHGLARLVFKPYQSSELLGQSLSAADVHLVILRPELEGLVVPSKFYSALAVGRPVIHVGDPEGEIPRTLAGCGYAVRSGDGAGLAKRILELYRDPVLRSRLGERARALLENRFDKPPAMRAWRELLRKTC